MARMDKVCLLGGDRMLGAGTESPASQVALRSRYMGPDTKGKTRGSTYHIYPLSARH